MTFSKTMWVQSIEAEPSRTAGRRRLRGGARLASRYARSKLAVLSGRGPVGGRRVGATTASRGDGMFRRRVRAHPRMAPYSVT